MDKTEIKWKSGIVTSWALDEVNLEKGIESQIHLLKEDLMQAQFGDAIILDLGWYPEFDLRGQFVISVVKGQEWENPILQLKFRKISQLTRNLNWAIEVADDNASN